MARSTNIHTVTLMSAEFVLPKGAPVPASFTWMSGWAPLVMEPHLIAALIALLPHAEQSIGRLVARQARAVVGDLDPGTYGQYAHHTNTITIARAIIDDHTSVVAAILAHELVHLDAAPTYPNTREGAALAVEEELRAFTAMAWAWEQLRTGAETSDAARFLDAAMRAKLDGTLIGFILRGTGYQRFSFGRELGRGAM
jgi:hypothetical protein